MSATASEIPVTFVERSFALFDVDQNAVLTTQFGNLAIFSPRGIAEQWAAKSSRKIEVRPVYIKPADH